MAIHQKVLSTTPENKETPLTDVSSWVTPNRWFFVRSHFETPEIDLEQWRLRFGGCVERELEFRWPDIESLPRRSVFCTMECAGNGRSFLTPRSRVCSGLPAPWGTRSGLAYRCTYCLNERG